VGARERVFRLVLRLYPEEFRDRFGGDMAAAYREARMDAAMRGRRSVAQFWLGVAADALVRAPGEHMRMTWQDIRYATRALRSTPVFTLVALATLTLGIGANTAIFSVVHAVALQPMPNRDPSRLVRIWEKNDSLNIPQFSVSVPNYLSWRERARSFAELAAWRRGSTTITTGGDPQQLQRLEATATLLPLLGVQPLAGRPFTADEDRPGGDRVALLAESVWRTRFGARDDITGSTIVLDGLPYTVIGVVRNRDVVVPFDLIVPLAADAAKEQRANHLMTAVARLRDGVTLQQAQQEMDTIALQLGKEYPSDDAGWGVTMATFYDWIVPVSVRTNMYVLLGCVALVLLIACTNLANLTLARSAVRRRDQAVRLALGASRARVVREVLTESVLLSVAGGGAGVLLASWAVPVFRAQLATVLPRAASIALNGPVLAFAVAVSIATGILFGALPAFFNSRRDVIGALKDSGRSGSARHQGLARRLLVVTELALATIVLAGAALLLESFVRLQRVELGFQPTRVTTAVVGLPRSRYPNHAAGWQFYSRLLQDLGAVPGVEAAALSSGPPLAGGNTGQGMRAVGANALGTKDLQADWRMVSPGYFQTMGIPLLRGRTFTDTDRRDGQRVIILSQDMARRFWPNDDPVGRSIESSNGDLRLQVIGVVGDVRNLNQAIDPQPTMYLSTTQFLWPEMTFVVRTTGDQPVGNVIRKRVNAVDPQLAVFAVRTFDTLLDTNIAQPKVTAWLFGMFAALALLLAAIGVYGVLSYLVAQRTREIGVRLALGAKPSSVLRLVVGHALRLSLWGIAIGVAGALAAGPALRSQLFGVQPRDPVTLAAVAAGLLAIALLASYLPARRATHVDPLKALRVE
jgi:putative ABC transport system permease protein